MKNGYYWYFPHEDDVGNWFSDEPQIVLVDGKEVQMVGSDLTSSLEQGPQPWPTTPRGNFIGPLEVPGTHNNFNLACLEWLKGCSNTDSRLGESGEPQDCQECTDAFLRAVKRIGGKSDRQGPNGVELNKYGLCSFRDGVLVEERRVDGSVWRRDADGEMVCFVGPYFTVPQDVHLLAYYPSYKEYPCGWEMVPGGTLYGDPGQPVRCPRCGEKLK